MGDDSSMCFIKNLLVGEDMNVEDSDIDDPDLIKSMLMCVFVSYFSTKKFKSERKNKTTEIYRKAYRIRIYRKNVFIQLYNVLMF